MSEDFVDSQKPLNDDGVEIQDDIVGNLPPGRMHVVNPRMMRLKPDSAPGTPRSRSRSPSVGRATGTTMDSSLSSLEDVDVDILTDRAALDDLSESQRQKLQIGLLPVLERMTEDTLEDVHAFSDITARSQSSRVSVSSEKNFDGVLGRLDECDEEEEIAEAQQIILTNMENLNMEDESMSQYSESNAAVGPCTINEEGD